MHINPTSIISSIPDVFISIYLDQKKIMKIVKYEWHACMMKNTLITWPVYIRLIVKRIKNLKGLNKFQDELRQKKTLWTETQITSNEPFQDQAIFLFHPQPALDIAQQPFVHLQPTVLHTMVQQAITFTNPHPLPVKGRGPCKTSNFWDANDR